MADELGIAKSTAHALLAELTRAGLTARLPCGRYHLGWRTLGLARTMLATSRHYEGITPVARMLASRFGETVHVAAWERGRVLYVATARPPGGVAAPAEPVAAELTSLGMVLLAERAGDTGGLDAGELERTRRRGFEVGAQRAFEGVDCAAGPVRVSDEPATAALARALRATGSGRGVMSMHARSRAPASASRDPFGYEVSTPSTNSRRRLSAVLLMAGAGA